MSLTLIVLLLLAGLALLMIEMFFIPGFGITGIAGLLIIASAIALGYTQAGAQTGHLLLAGTLATAAVLIFFSLRTTTWKNTGLKSSIDSRMENIRQGEKLDGYTGKTLSRLAPAGKVLINGKVYEAHAVNDFINEDTEIIVLKTIQNKLIVKPLNH